MTILDCESYESALRSVSEIYRVEPSELIRMLSGFDLHGQYIREERVYDGTDEFLKERFESLVGKQAKPLETVCWFHLTAVPLGTTFSEGILPLPEVRNKLWDTLISIVPNPKIKANLATMRDDGFTNEIYEQRLSGFEPGPFGMLVRETAFHANGLGNVDYLEMSETLADICRSYNQIYGVDVCAEVSHYVRGCIVKFESTKCLEEYLIGAALVYCWCKVNSLELDRSVVHGFDGEGIAIPRRDIKKIEFV